MLWIFSIINVNLLSIWTANIWSLFLFFNLDIILFFFICVLAVTCPMQKCQINFEDYPFFLLQNVSRFPSCFFLFNPFHPHKTFAVTKYTTIQFPTQKKIGKTFFFLRTERERKCKKEKSTEKLIIFDKKADRMGTIKW